MSEESSYICEAINAQKWETRRARRRANEYLSKNRHLIEPTLNYRPTHSFIWWHFTEESHDKVMKEKVVYLDILIRLLK